MEKTILICGSGFVGKTLFGRRNFGFAYFGG